ncbi:MAG: transketolase [Simkaniaceae bacterium]|nr:transketolase [Simkaniaceae bacterium]
MDAGLKKILSKTAGTIRQLSMEAVQKAGSGHPGLPMGCAELGAYLYGVQLEHNPEEPSWVNRDRVILSAGHGSMWLYSCLHLAGFDLSLDEIKRFRQLHSKTAGHPEYGEAPGIEATTGPLGQGVGNAVGHALGLKILATKYNRPGQPVISAKVYCLAGDGCLMEGVSNEASSFAGHVGLDNLVLIHDDNDVTLDGPIEECSSENVAARYEAYGFATHTVNGNDLDSIDGVMRVIKQPQTKPTFISCKTVIGKGSPHKQGTYKAHGAPLGVEEVALTKKELGLPEEEFYVSQQVKTFFAHRLVGHKKEYEKWCTLFDEWKTRFPDEAEEFDSCMAREVPKDLVSAVERLDIAGPISGRKAAQAVLGLLGEKLPFLYGGSADLSGSDCTMMGTFSLIASGNFAGRNIKYGVREFGMATIASGLFQTGAFLPYVGTFLTFSDYMRNAIRLASLSRYRVVYQFTHDSVFLGEDGPTHQPIEHLAALRAMPHLRVLRPADAHEVKGAWLAALSYQGPSAIILSRQNLPVLDKTDVPFHEGVAKGAYVLETDDGELDFTLFATGSEVTLALDTARALREQGKRVRVVSFPCFELFEIQDEEYKASVVEGNIGKRVVIEAGSPYGWHRYIGRDGLTVCMEGYGLSAPLSDLAQEFGFTVDAVLDRILTAG